MKLPQLKFDTFSGAHDEYDIFVSTFVEVVGRIITDPATKLIRLKSHVSGIAADAIKSCRTQDGAEAYTRVCEHRGTDGPRPAKNPSVRQTFPFSRPDCPAHIWLLCTHLHTL